MKSTAGMTMEGHPLNQTADTTTGYPGPPMQATNEFAGREFAVFVGRFDGACIADTGWLLSRTIFQRGLEIDLTIGWRGYLHRLRGAAAARWAALRARKGLMARRGGR